MSRKKITGINIQFPISRLILSGDKTVETRTYPIPKNYINQDLLMIETPGREGKFEARGVCLVRFSECYQYKTQLSFRSEFHLHKVENGSQWDWTSQKPKWGWKISKIVILKSPIIIKKRKGIVFTKNLSISSSAY